MRELSKVGMGLFGYVKLGREWKCMACDRVLGYSEELGISVKTRNGQKLTFIPYEVVGQCKCGLETTHASKYTRFRWCG